MKEIETQAVLILADGRMDTKNASVYSGLSEKTLAMKRSAGTGPKYIKKGKVFYFRTDVDEWLMSEGKISSTSQSPA